MKVLDLQCSARHAFEGWFGSEAEFQRQLAQGLVECPYCGQRDISKKLSAPRLNLGASAPSESTTQSVVSVGEETQQAMQLAWINMVRQVLEQTEDVGDGFVEEARRIHYGETKRRGIRGQASREETEALLDEGIAVAPLLLPHALRGPMQ